MLKLLPLLLEPSNPETFKSRRRPMVVFYNILDVSAYNAFKHLASHFSNKDRKTIILCFYCKNYLCKKHTKRFTFCYTHIHMHVLARLFLELVLDFYWFLFIYIILLRSSFTIFKKLKTRSMLSKERPKGTTPKILKPIFSWIRRPRR